MWFALNKKGLSFFIHTQDGFWLVQVFVSKFQPFFWPSLMGEVLITEPVFQCVGEGWRKLKWIHHACEGQLETVLQLLMSFVQDSANPLLQSLLNFYLGSSEVGISTTALRLIDDILQRRHRNFLGSGGLVAFRVTSSGSSLLFPCSVTQKNIRILFILKWLNDWLWVSRHMWQPTCMVKVTCFISNYFLKLFIKFSNILSKSVMNICLEQLGSTIYFQETLSMPHHTFVSLQRNTCVDIKMLHNCMHYFVLLKCLFFFGHNCSKSLKW